MSGDPVMRLSEKGRAVSTEIGFWLEDDGSIHMTIKGHRSGHVAVNADPKKRNGHPTLYRRLAEALRDARAPTPSSGQVRDE